jgi:predicted metal-dependent enzyme (double-stranded beta helix superfamily)
MQSQVSASPVADARLGLWTESRFTASPKPHGEPLPGLHEIIRTVDEAVGKRDSAAIVADLCARLPALIERHRGHIGADLLRVDPTGYRRIELHHCPIRGYQIVAMVWGPGQGTPVHDHRDVWGVESVLCGELLVADFRATAVAGELLRLVPVNAVHLRPGEAVGLTPEQGLHLCRNPSPRSAAVSLQVYARPLDHFNVYLDAGDGWYQRTDFAPALER